MLFRSSHIHPCSSPSCSPPHPPLLLHCPNSTPPQVAKAELVRREFTPAGPRYVPVKPAAAAAAARVAAAKSVVPGSRAAAGGGAAREAAGGGARSAEAVAARPEAVEYYIEQYMQQDPEGRTPQGRPDSVSPSGEGGGPMWLEVRTRQVREGDPCG